MRGVFSLAAICALQRPLNLDSQLRLNHIYKILKIPCVYCAPNAILVLIIGGTHDVILKVRAISYSFDYAITRVIKI
jgi:hypothetical protein